MALIWFIGVIFALLFVVMHYAAISPELKKPVKYTAGPVTLYLLLAVALVLRIIIAASIQGYDIDINCFKAWASMAYQGGLSNFYVSGSFTDYPPGYIYVLWLLGAIQDLFGPSESTFIVFLKLPAILCDIVTSWLIYQMAKKHVGAAAALALSSVYAFNPAVLVNSAAWGQVDSVYTLFVILLVYYLTERKLLPACVCFTIGFLIKPQMIIFSPVLLFGIYDIVFGVYHSNALPDGEERSARFRRGGLQLLIAFGVCLALIFLLLLPFAKDFNFYVIFNQYVKTLTSYPYASVNAFNLFALFGGNWKSIDAPFLFLTYGQWSDIFIVLNVIFAAWVFVRRKGQANLFAIASLVIVTMFVLAGKMHERYVFPALSLLLLAFACKRDMRYLWVFCVLGLTQFVNTAAMLYQKMVPDTTAPPGGVTVPLVAIINIAVLAYLVYIAFTGNKEVPIALKNTSGKNIKPKASPVKKSGSAKAVSGAAAASGAGLALKPSAPALKLVKWDYIIMAVITLIYSAVALFNLGDMKAPETYWNGNTGDGFVVAFSGNAHVTEIKFFTGVAEGRKMKMRTGVVSGDASVQWSEQSDIDLSGVLAWHKTAIDKNVNYIEFTATQDRTLLHEITFTDSVNRVLPIASITPVGLARGMNNLYDEQGSVPAQLSYRNSSYFDEIYHARTAYEYLHLMWPYENTHPPLGKLIIALGMAIFGVNPFGWRIMGTLFGIAMLPLTYLFTKKMFGRTSVAAFATVLFAADFMHFAQTRIATIDVYVTFFIIAMYFFMYIYYRMSFYDTPFYKTLIPLGLSGLCMGLGIASKWTGIYAAFGLALIFAISLINRRIEYNKIAHNKRSSPAQKAAVAVCGKYTGYTLLWCLLFFVAIPAVIYAASYIPFMNAPGAHGLKTLFENQKTMLSYHAHLNATHPFSSSWYQWPIIYKPIWYYSGNAASPVLRETIASFGNPFIWWAGISAFVGVIVLGIFKRDARAAFLVIGYLAQYLPWVGVTRIAFIYHYFTCVPFIILMLAYVAWALIDSCDSGSAGAKRGVQAGIWVYAAACVILFIAFYPVLSGMPVSNTYIDALKWFKDWSF